MASRWGVTFNPFFRIWLIIDSLVIMDKSE
jgi:hypothetical protein